MIPGLPPAASSWTLTSLTSAAISYADRGTSAIAASGLLADLGWTEGQLGAVQSSFFLGYGLTQVVGGLLSEGSGHRSKDDAEEADVYSDDDEKGVVAVKTGAVSSSNGSSNNGREAYRAILPLSLFLTAVTTLLFPLSATYGGPALASLDRFLLGIFEGLLLPSAMTGISQLCPAERRATASAAVIAGCYLGSALAYGSATILFSSPVVDWIAGGSGGSAWPYVFYVNGLLSFLCLLLARSEFDWSLSDAFGANSDDSRRILSSAQDLVSDTLEVGKATLSSTSGRAIIAAQIGQGALLYSIASWGPLYIERMGLSPTGGAGAESNELAVTSAAASAAAALIGPQLTQAAVGVGVGAASDAMAQKVGVVPTRRALQGLGGVVPAILLGYLAIQPAVEVEEAIVSPVMVFAAAQTISALSLGAVSVSHLEVAPRNAGAVYALGNVAAAVSGSLTINIFGRLLEAAGGSDFSRPFLLVAALSASGSLVYATTVRSEPEILVKTRAAS